MAEQERVTGAPIKAEGTPVKDFFINMITKDISLQDCILDLLDNCLDGANKLLKHSSISSQSEKYCGYKGNIHMTSEEFRIEDNCGGISLEDARHYAFHFGRRPDAPSDAEYPIGLYGIGMKRAMFKIGKYIEISSSTAKEAFRLTIDVPAWAKEGDWDFFLEEYEPISEPGTSIKIISLNPGVGAEFDDIVFQNRLRKIVSRDYSLFLQAGFQVFLNDVDIKPYNFSLRQSGDFKPLKIEYRDQQVEAVFVTIAAGMAALPPDDDSAESPQNVEVEYYGWFVACNDRIVLAGNKDENTVWGHEDFVRWHPQYNGFMGILHFCSTDPSKLPWKTTKRNLDVSDPLYRRAVLRMKQITRPYLQYTTERKADLEKAKEVEKSTKPVPIKDLEKREQMVLPKYDEKKSTIKFSSIQYLKPESDVRKVAEALGNRRMPNKDVGIKTFDYYWKNEIDE